MNYWGYSNVGFFAPKAGYAATGKFGMQVDELKTLIKDLHANGIEVILDVVFNHTAEGNENGPYISYRGIDNKTYYILTPDGYYYNFSGCGNTLNCNNPIVRNMILDCLRYWAAEYHVDGFRFDLASILGQGPERRAHGQSAPARIAGVRSDPRQMQAHRRGVGRGRHVPGRVVSLPRDAGRSGTASTATTCGSSLQGDAAVVGGVAQRLQGSPDLYSWQGRGANAPRSISSPATTGSRLMDLVSYNGKHNEANGENNNDGNNDNHSWNCGWEGPSTSDDVNRLRRKQIKNAVALMLVSRGVPMLLSGDEMGHTQQGNNNCYCQDNEISWLDWDDVDRNREIFDFCRGMVAFRKAHPVLRNSQHFQNRDFVGSGLPDISWHSTRKWWADFSSSLTLAFMLDGRHAKNGTATDSTLYVAMNMHWEAHGFELPSRRPGTPCGMWP